MARLTDDEIRDRVRARYAAAATSAECGCGTGDCGQEVRTADRAGDEVFGAGLYDGLEPEMAGSGILSLGCGVPTAVADLHPGETVLDLGSGAGGDVIISARRVGPTGMAIGIDMTDEMLEQARHNAAEAGVTNVRFVKGNIEELPLPGASVDVVISNCVINLAADKVKVLAEASRVLRPGGRLAISDVIADEEIDEATRSDMEQWTGCIAGALTRRQFEAALTGAGLVDVEITETHRVHEHAAAAIVRAQRPASAGCCSSDAQAVCCQGAGEDRAAAACSQTPRSPARPSSPRVPPESGTVSNLLKPAQTDYWRMSSEPVQCRNPFLAGLS